VFSHVRYARQLLLKREIVLDAFARIAHLPLPDLAVVESPEHGYRMRARLHAGGGRLGFFREGSHDLCDPATTGQLLPETCRVIEEVARRVPPVAVMDLAENLDANQRVLHLEMLDWSA
jgi:tRNA/tmRNA/rRNA uracil-C5-methylase (TrmA/RlmC/RlmD family)